MLILKSQKGIWDAHLFDIGKIMVLNTPSFKAQNNMLKGVVTLLKTLHLALW